jgi:type VI secretion system secreted protein VgrG
MSIVFPNVSRFALAIPGLANHDVQKGSFTVLSFQSLVNNRWTESTDLESPFYWSNRCGQHGLSEHYIFEIEVQARHFVEPDNLLTQVAQLQCDDTVFHGYLSRVICLPTAPSGHRYRFILSSPLYPLTQHASPKVFIDKTVPEIIEECLSLYAWKKGQLGDYYIDLQEDYPKLSCWIQYAENDWDHLQRLLRRHGLFFYFVQTLEHVTVIFSDRLNHSEPLSVSFNQANQSLFNLQSLGQVLRGTTLFSTYNPESPRDPWIASQKAAKIGCTDSSHGTVHIHGSGADSEEQNAKLAMIQQQSLDWQRSITLASTTLSGLQPGQAISVHDYPIAHLNQIYTIIDIEHLGNQSAAHLGNRAKEQDTAPPNYTNRLMLIPYELPFRKYDGYAPRMQAPLRGTLESAEADVADAAIDETGHYRFRYPFDTGDNNPIGMASPKTRFTQLMGAAGQGLAGMHFPNRHGTQVEVVFLQGNINCPIIVGALSTPGAVNQNNPYQSLVRTAKGHEWCLDDTPENESIRLSTADQKEILELKANSEDIGITLQTMQGAMSLQAAQDIRWETTETLSIKASDYEGLIRDNYHLDAGVRINWETAGNFFLKAEFMQLSGPELSIDSEQNLIMETEGLHCSSPDKTSGSTLTFSADNTLCIESADIQLRAHDTLTIENAGAKIVFENGNIRLTSPGEIEFIGDSVQFIGSQQRG